MATFTEHRKKRERMSLLFVKRNYFTDNSKL